MLLNINKWTHRLCLLTTCPVSPLFSLINLVQKVDTPRVWGPCMVSPRCGAWKCAPRASYTSLTQGHALKRCGACPLIILGQGRGRGQRWGSSRLQPPRGLVGTFTGLAQGVNVHKIWVSILSTRTRAWCYVSIWMIKWAERELFKTMTFGQ